MGHQASTYTMKESLLEELMSIPPEATSATVQGVLMQVIDERRARTMLDTDPDDEIVHECWLANGHFLFESGQGRLKALFKVLD